MSNMGYCQFRNTLSDLEDCAEALENGEAEKDHKDPLSEEERNALKEMLRLCKRITDNYDFYDEE